jgi:hypothetical protein
MKLSELAMKCEFDLRPFLSLLFIKGSNCAPLVSLGRDKWMFKSNVAQKTNSSFYFRFD